MYDEKNEAHEFMADSRDEAIRKATDFFGVDVEALRVGEFEAGKVYGLGGRAVIVASLRNRTRPTPGRSPGRGSARGSKREDAGRGERPPRGGGGRRGEGREGRASRESRRGDHGGSDRADDRAEPAVALSDEPSVGSVRGEVGEIGKFLLGVVERVNVGPFEISESAEGELLVYELKGAAADVLASGDGRTVDALQLLANQVAQRHELDVRVVVEVEGNAEAREELLSRLASRAASRGRKSGRAVALDPMNGHDRRTIHLALRDEDGVATMSVGEGRYRQVVIVPEGAPEYEQALRESETARSGEGR